MFGLGFGEIVIIAILALLLLGPDRLPEAAKQLGRTLREIRKHTDELKEQFEAEVYGNGTSGVAKPSLVPPVPAQAAGPAGPPPPATAENVPGLEAALAGEPARPVPSPAAQETPVAMVAEPAEKQP